MIVAGQILSDDDSRFEIFVVLVPVVPIGVRNEPNPNSAAGLTIRKGETPIDGFVY